MNKNFKIAFTLVELLVVIAIIGILSGLIVVGMNSSIQSATMAKAQIFSNSVRNSLLINLLTEWKFDEGTGSVVTDSWRGSYNGTLGEQAYAGSCDATHCPQWQTSGCVYNGCLLFDGINDYANVPSLGSPSSFTLLIWMRNIGAGTGTQGYTTLLGSSHGSFVFGFNRTTLDYFIDFSSESGWGSDASGGLKIDNGRWMLYGVVYDKNLQEIRAYKDVQENKWINKNLTTNNLDGYLGGGWPGTYNSYFYGIMDDVRFFNSAVSTSQIGEYYYSGLSNLLSKGEINKDEYQRALIEVANNAN